MKWQSTNNEIDHFCSPNLELNFFRQNLYLISFGMQLLIVQTGIYILKNENFLLSSWKYKSNRVVP